ncbi:hypothetical protein MBANPS3_009886 [Mucor bainieri]
MPYYNFEGITKKHQLQVWHTITTVRIVLHKLDEFSFHTNNGRYEIRQALNSISTNDPRYCPFHKIASSSNRFGENLVCYNMTSGDYVEIFNSLYKALEVNASPTANTTAIIPVCNDSYNAALETYSANLLQLKMAILAGLGAYSFIDVVLFAIKLFIDMYVYNTLQIRPELDQYRTHRWRPLRELLVTIRALENCNFVEADDRAQARHQLDAAYINGTTSMPVFDVNLRFPPRKTMVNITLEPYATVANSMYGLLQHGDVSDLQSCEHLAPHYYALIQEFKRLLELRVGVFTREIFESEFHLQWKE